MNGAHGGLSAPTSGDAPKEGCGSEQSPESIVVFDGDLGVRSANRLNVLIQTSIRVVAEKNLDGLLQTVAEAARHLTNARVSISGYRDVNQQFVVGGASRVAGSPSCPPDGILKIERGGVYLDLFERRPTLRLTEEQLHEHPAWWGLPDEHPPLRGLLGARLIDAEGQPMGLLMVSDKDEGDFTEEDEALLLQLAAMTSLAMQHIAARTDAERHVQEAGAAEAALQESQRKLATLMRNLPGMAYRCLNDCDWTMEFASEGCLALTGYEPSSLIAKNPVSYASLIHADDRDKVWSQIQHAIAERHPFEVEYRLRTATGEEKWCWEQGVGVYSDHGEVEAIEGFISDITRLKRAEADLKTLAETLAHRVADRTATAEQQAVQLRDMAWEVTEAEQRERRRLAQVLHDHLQQLLVAARLKASQLRRRLAEESLHHMTQELDELINEAIIQSRSLTAELSPAVLYEAGLIAGLDWLAREMLTKHQLRVAIKADRAAEPTTEDARILLFAAARELLFNVVKHAQAESALVVLSQAGADWVRLEVIDEGVGFDPASFAGAETSRNGFGLFSIRKRLGLLGGHFEVESAPGRGAHVTILAPCHSARLPAEAKPWP